jgi:MFS family permease
VREKTYDYKAFVFAISIVIGLGLSFAPIIGSLFGGHWRFGFLWTMAAAGLPFIVAYVIAPRIAARRMRATVEEFATDDTETLAVPVRVTVLSALAMERWPSLYSGRHRWSLLEITPTELRINDATIRAHDMVDLGVGGGTIDLRVPGERGGPTISLLRGTTSAVIALQVNGALEKLVTSVESR